MLAVLWIGAISARSNLDNCLLLCFINGSIIRFASGLRITRREEIVIYKLELQGNVHELCWFPTIDDAVDDLIHRNEAAGRKIAINEASKGSVQFSLIYPSINRKIDGTISRYGLGGRLPIDPSDVLDDVEKMMKQRIKRSEICRILSISTATYLNAKRIIQVRKKTQNWRNGIE